MNTVLVAAGAAAGLFAGTNVDDLVVLAVLSASSRAGGRPERWQIWAGQYAGIAVLVAGSVAAGRGLTLMPERWIWLLGLLPLGLGTGKLITAIRTRRRGSQGVVAAASLPGVAGITIANGGDNLAAYTPSSPPSAASPRRSRPRCSLPVPRYGAWPGGGWSPITASPIPCGAGATGSFPPSIS